VDVVWGGRIGQAALLEAKRHQISLTWAREFRAVKLGDGDANLEIARIYLRRKPGTEKAIPYLTKACRAKRNQITEQGREDAMRLLKRIRKRGRIGPR